MLLVDSISDFQDSCSSDPFNSGLCRDSMMSALSSMSALHDMWREGEDEVVAKKLPYHLRPKAHLQLPGAQSRAKGPFLQASYFCSIDMRSDFARFN